MKRDFASRGKCFGAGGRNRTDMELPPRDFESRASTSFTTPAPDAAKLVLCIAFATRSPDFPLDPAGVFAMVVGVGVVAQLGEHLTGSQEVTGSIPVNSTIF